jgi:hypothetical protein
LNNIEETGEAHIPNPISTTGNHGNNGNTVNENRVNRNVLGALTVAQSGVSICILIHKYIQMYLCINIIMNQCQWL